MLLLAVLLQATTPDIVVRAPLPPAPQVPATMVVEPAAMLIAACDGDGDAAVERPELDTCLARAFETAPDRKDGAIRYIAYGDWALQWLGDRAALPSPYEVDRNADDKVTLTELQDHFGRLFARYDRDGDKRVTRAELITYRTVPVGANGPATPPSGAKPPNKRPPRR